MAGPRHGRRTFSAAAGPLCDEGDLGVGDIGECLDGHVVEDDDACNDEQQGGKENKIFIKEDNLPTIIILVFINKKSK